jgi:hypothetical protein
LRRERLHLSTRSKHSRSYAASAKDRNVTNACVGTGRLRVGPRIRSMTILIASAAGLRQHLDRSFLSPIKARHGAGLKRGGLQAASSSNRRSRVAYLAEPRARANSAGAAQRPAPPSPTGAGAGASRPSALIVQNPSQTPLSLIRRFNRVMITPNIAAFGKICLTRAADPADDRGTRR